MNKNHRDQFEKRFSAFQIPKSEIDRMYERDLEFQLHLQWMAEQALANQKGGVTSSPAGGGGSSSSTTTPAAASIHFFINHSDNISFLVANYALETVSEPYDTGIAYDSGSSYVISSANNVHNGGFLAIFYDNANSWNHAFFISNTGEVIDNIYSATSDYGELNESLSFFAAYEPSGSPTYTTFKLFDGYEVTTFTLDGVTSFGWSGCSAETVLINYNSPSEYHLLNTNGQDIKIWENTDDEELYDTFNEWTSGFTCGFVTLPGTSDYLKFKVWNDSGELLINEDISGYTTNSIDQARIYGTDGRFLAVLQNGSDVNIDYLIIHYDYSTNNLLIDTHERGTNFPSCDVYAEDPEKRDPANSMKNNGVIVFRDSGPGPIGFGFISVEYLDVWCMHHTQTSFFKEVITAGDEFGLRVSSNPEEGAIYSGDPFFLFYDKTAVTPEIQVAAFTSTGMNTFELGFDDPDDIADASATESIAPDHAFLRFELNSDPGVWQWRIFNSDGTTLISRTTSDGFTLGGGSMYNTLAVIDLNDYTNCFTFSPNQGIGNLSDPSPNIYGVIAYNDVENEFGTITGYSPQSLVVLTLDAGTSDPIGFRVFNDNLGLSSYVEFPAYDAFDTIRFGETVLAFNYFNAIDQGYSVKMYSLETGEELSSTDTVNLLGDQDSSADFGDRIWKSFNIGGTLTYYFSFASGAVSAALGANVIDTAYNDAYWIDNNS